MPSDLRMSQCFESTYRFNFPELHNVQDISFFGRLPRPLAKFCRTVNPRMATRREVLMRIGATAGASMIYRSMSAFGAAKESTYSGRISLTGAPPDTEILVLGAGMAGLVAAYELQRAGYKVKVLE